MICVFINMTGTPEGSTDSGFMEKPGIEPATPGLQGIALIHYTTGACKIKDKLQLYHSNITLALRQYTGLISQKNIWHHENVPHFTFTMVK